MSNIVVKMKDGTEHKFMHAGRPGGSYTKSLRYEPGFIVIEDEYGKRISLPSADIEKVTETPHYY